MATYRPNSEIRDSFEKTAAFLDEAVRRARALGGGDLQVLDHSNRSGFEKCGCPYYLYDVALEDRQNDGPVARARVQVSFFEPFDPSVERQITVSWLAEKFWLGSSASLFKQSDSRILRSSDAASLESLVDVIVDMLRTARHALVLDEVRLPRNSSRDQ
jgi:hypothetical protein